MANFDQTITAYLAGSLSADSVAATMVPTTPTPPQSTDDILRDSNEDIRRTPQPGTYADLAAYRASMPPARFQALRDAYLRRFSV